MGPDLAEQACPRCQARRRPDDPWCTQCYLDLRPPAPLPHKPTGAPRPQPAADEQTWPCTVCGAPNPLSLGDCAACGAGFLAAVRDATRPLLVLPVVGDVAALRPAQRFGLAGLVIAVVAVLTLLLGVLL